MIQSFARVCRIESFRFHNRQWRAEQLRMKARLCSQDASTSKGRLNRLAIVLVRASVYGIEEPG